MKKIDMDDIINVISWIFSVLISLLIISVFIAGVVLLVKWVWSWF